MPITDTAVQHRLWCSPDAEWSYTATPKCNQRVWEEMLRVSQWSQSAQPTQHRIAVVRNPVFRIVSGITEWRKAQWSNLPDWSSNWSQCFYELLRDPTQFDAHLEPQSYFVQDSDVLIRFECQYLDAVRQAVPIPHQLLERKLFNSIASDSMQAALDTVCTFRDLIDRCVLKWYQADVELYASCQHTKRRRFY